MPADPEAADRRRARLLGLRGTSVQTWLGERMVARTTYRWASLQVVHEVDLSVDGEGERPWLGGHRRVDALVGGARVGMLEALAAAARGERQPLAETRKDVDLTPWEPLL